VAITPAEAAGGYDPKVAAALLEVAIDAGLRKAGTKWQAVEITVPGRAAVDDPEVLAILRARYQGWLIESSEPAEIQRPGDALGVTERLPATRFRLTPL